MIDCQQELFHRGNTVRRQMARLKTALAVAIVCAVGGWVTVAILIWIRANN